MFIRLYYSNKCKECMNLWTVICNENIMKMFIPICVDNFTSKQISTLSIKQVPAIVISAENQRPSICEGPVQCSQWLTNFTINKRRNLAQQVEHDRRLIQKAHSTARVQDGGPLEFCEAEMDGISDGYAYNGTDLCQPKSFVRIGDEETNFIRTPKMVENKIDLETMKRQLHELESSRNMDNQQFMRVMEQNQIRSVINSNGNY